MAHDIDYFSIDIPEDKPPTEWHYTRRRADLLQIILRAGGPHAMSRTQAQLAERYGVDQSQISYDIDALGDYIDAVLGNRSKFQTRAAFDRIYEELLDEDDWRAKKAAWDMVMDWDEWLGDLGEQDREPDHHEFDMDISGGGSGYRVVHDEDDIDEDEAGFSSTPVTSDSGEDS